MADSARPAERRQLQFATPGGTRIIWTFDPDFSVKETDPMRSSSALAPMLALAMW